MRISGVRGEPPPPTLKVGLATLGGFRNEVVFVLTGLDIEAKAALVQEQLAGFDATWTLARTDHADAATEEEASALLHCVVRGADPKAIGRAFSGAAVELALASYPGFHVTAPPGDAEPYGVFTAAHVAAADVDHIAVLADGTRLPSTPPTETLRARRRRGAAAAGTARRADPPRAAGHDRRRPLRRQGRQRQRRRVGAHRRRVALARQPPHRRRAAPAAPRDRRRCPVTRHVLPNLRALNFVVDGLLGEGVAVATPASTRRPRRSASGCAPATSTSPRRCCDHRVVWSRRRWRPRWRPPRSGTLDDVLRSPRHRSAEFAANREAMLAQLAEVDAEHAKALAGGGPKYTERHHQRGKLLARERIELLLDEDSPFLELSPLAAYGSPYTVGASVVTGIGVVSGVECLISASDPTVKGGASNPFTLRKAFRAADIAFENRLPTIHLVESGGADLPTQKEIFIPGGRTFRDLTRASAHGIPTIALVFGNSTAGGAYLPGMSDHVVMVKERAKVFLAGPPLLKMATGEEADDESLGGAEMHSRVSGLSDHLAADERDAIRLGRRIVARLNWRKLGPPPAADVAPPVHDEEDLLGLVPPDLKTPFDPREVIARDRRRLRVRRVQAALRDVAGHRLGAPARLPARHPRQRPRRAVQRGVAEGDPVHPARQPRRHAAAVPAEHHRLHGRQGVRAGRDHQARGDDDQRRHQLDGAAPHRHARGLLRRRQLRHVRAGVPAALPVHLAECQVGGDGAAAARRRAVDRRPAAPPPRAARTTTRMPTRRCGPPSRGRSRASRTPW